MQWKFFELTYRAIIICLINHILQQSGAECKICIPKIVCNHNNISFDYILHIFIHIYTNLIITFSINCTCKFVQFCLMSNHYSCNVTTYNQESIQIIQFIIFIIEHNNICGCAIVMLNNNCKLLHLVLHKTQNIDC